MGILAQGRDPGKKCFSLFVCHSFFIPLPYLVWSTSASILLILVVIDILVFVRSLLSGLIFFSLVCLFPVPVHFVLIVSFLGEWGRVGRVWGEEVNGGGLC